MIKSLPVVLITLFLCLGACSPGHNDFNSFTDVPEQGWAYGDTIKFATDTIDSISIGNLQVSIRHDNSYLYRNLWLEICYISNGRVTRDTVNMELADIYGRWLGKGFGASYQFVSDIPHKVTLEKGTTISVNHIMRLDTLHGIEQVGIRLKKE